MIKKKGVSVTILAITIIILTILAGVITASIYSSLNFSKLATWANEIEYIKNVYNEKRTRSSSLDVSLGSISIDVSELSNEDIEEQFAGETIEDSQVELDILDLGKLGISNTTYGNKKTANDVYAYSETTGRVYYVEGVRINGKTYYTLADSLFDMFGITRQNTNLTTIVFVPSIIGYTNQAVSVTVKVPTSFTGVTVTTSNNNILIGPVTLNGNVNEYVVNTSNVTGNYTITVTYTNDGEEYTSTYEVNGYDDEEPTINASKNENGQYVIQVSDNNSIKELKYIEGEIEQANIVSYFENNGKQVINGKFKSDENIVKYTVFAKDFAGNYSYKVIKNYIEVNVGDYIEYNVAYTDVIVNDNEYTTLNGWRILYCTENSDGTYSNVKIISTGVPAKLYFYLNDTSSNKSWWETDDTKLTDYRNILKNTGGDGLYSFWSDTNDNEYKALYVGAGLYYNFGDIKFMYSADQRGYNLGYFEKILSNGATYSSTVNNNVEKTGSQLFNLLGTENADVRLSTLPEVNLYANRTNIDSIGRIMPETVDLIGLYRLENLTQVPNLDSFTNYSSYEYWIASPYPTHRNYAIYYYTNGNVQGNCMHKYGVRPVISLKTNKKVKFKDTNNNGVPEIQIIN